MRAQDYNQFIEEALDGMTRIRNCKPFFQTVTFKRFVFTGEERLADHCFKVTDSLYQHTCSNLIRNYARQSKRHLQPITYDFIDAAGSKSTTITKLETVPHIHSIVLVDNSIAQKYQNFFSLKLNHDLGAITTQKPASVTPIRW